MLDTSAILAIALAAAAHAVPAAAATAHHAQQIAAADGSGAALTGGRRGLRLEGAIPTLPESLDDGGDGEGEGGSDEGEGETPDDTEGVVECTTRTTELEVTIERSAEVHNDAISKVFAMACEHGSAVNVKMFEDIFMEQDAFVFAHATASAMITCSSDSDDAYLCASVTASATAYAEATAEAHASAVSTAVSSCGCMTDAVSVAVATSEIYVNLIAEASATATASVCLEGAGSVSATAYDSCSSLVFGKVFARAVAEAIVQGSCLNSEAITRVLTEAGADFDSFSTCGMTAEAIIIT